MSNKKYDFGCGLNKCKGFLGVDAKHLPGVDIVIKTKEDLLQFPDECASVIHSSHFIEHHIYQDAMGLFNLWYKMLVDGGSLITYFPDMDKLTKFKHHPHFKNWICGLQRDPYDYHISWWNVYLVTIFLTECGFKDIKEISYPQLYHTAKRGIQLMSGLEAIK